MGSLPEVNPSSDLTEGATQPFRRVRPLLGTLVEITLYLPEEPGDAANDCITEAFGLIEGVHAAMSAHSPDSDLAGIARRAHQEPVAIGNETAEVLRNALEWAEATEGAFDPVKAGGQLIAAGRRPLFTAEPPDPGSFWWDLFLVDGKVSASRPLAVDLGGVAKGHAVDLAAHHLEKAGLSGLVNAGGDIRFFGTAPRIVQIRRVDAPGEFFELSHLPKEALATTAAYGSLDEEGSDLCDTYRGGGADAVISVTVFAGACALADALTKAVLNLPADAAAGVLRRFDAFALILRADGSIHELPGLPAED